MIEGRGFALVESAGDFAAFSLVGWVSDGPAPEWFNAWNIRAGFRITRRNECDGCTVGDIELTSNGSIAYTGCTRAYCDVVSFDRAGSRRVLDTKANPALLVVDGQLRWLRADGSLGSVPFP